MSNVANKGITKSMLIMLLIMLLVISLAIYLMPTVHAAEDDVTTWNTSGTCEWGIDPDGCLWIRPANGVSGILAAWSGEYSNGYGYGAPWHSQSSSIKSVVVKPGVVASTCAGMFYSCNNMITADLSNLDTSNVTNMHAMFCSCKQLTSAVICGFNTSNVTNMASMFKDCWKIKSLDLSGFDTGKVTDMGAMFYQCGMLRDLDVSSFDTGNVTSMAGMFRGCLQLTSLDVSGFDTSNVTNMEGMFSSCSSLTSLDVSGFDTSNVTNMDSMFSGCSSLTSLDLSEFDTSRVTNMNCMFEYCGPLKSVDLSSFNTTNVTSMDRMFGGVVMSYASGSETAEIHLPLASDFQVTVGPNTSFNKGGVPFSVPEGFVYSWIRTNTASGEVEELTNDAFVSAASITPGTWAVNIHGRSVAAVIQNDGNHLQCGHDSYSFQIPENAVVYRATNASASNFVYWYGEINDIYLDETDNLVWEEVQLQDGQNTISGTLATYDEYVIYKVSNPTPSMLEIAYLTDLNDESTLFDGVMLYGPGAATAETFAEVSLADSSNFVEKENGVYDYVSPNLAGYRPVAVYDVANMSAVLDGTEEVVWRQTNMDPVRISGVLQPTGETVIYAVVYEAVDPNKSEFNATLLLDQNASVPNATITFTTAPGVGMAAVPGTSLAVLAPTAENGVSGNPTIGTAAFAAGDETVTEVNGVTIAANQKAVVKPVSVDFNGVTFAQPGVFRYLITEPSTGYGLEYDTQLSDTENGVRHQRVLDVYVQRVDDAETGTTSYQIGGYVFHEVADAPAVGVDTAADKSTGFVHEYDTKSITIESRVTGNQSSIDKYFAYTITMQNPNNSAFTVTADWTNAADALHPTANPATKYDTATITAANTAEWTSNADGSMSKTIYLRNGQKVELDGIPAGATYVISVADEDYSPSWAIGSDNGTTNATGNRVLNALVDVVFTLTREGVVPTGVMLSAVPGLIIMSGALVAIITMRKRKEDQAEA